MMAELVLIFLYLMKTVGFDQRFAHQDSLYRTLVLSLLVVLRLFMSCCDIFIGMYVQLKGLGETQSKCSARAPNV